MSAPIALLHAEGISPALSSAGTAAAVAQGLRQGLQGWRVACAQQSGNHREWLMQDALRVVVIAAAGLCGPERRQGAAEQLAREARQAGVPAFAITSVAEPDLFVARMLDLQLLLTAQRPQELTAAGLLLGEKMLIGGLKPATKEHSQ